MNGLLALTKNIKKLFPLSQAAHITSRGSLSVSASGTAEARPKKALDSDGSCFWSWKLINLWFSIVIGNCQKASQATSPQRLTQSIQRESNCLHCCPPRNVPKYLLLLQVNPLNCFPALPHGLAGPRNCHHCCLKSPAPCCFVFGSEN